MNIATIAGSRHVGPIKVRVEEWGKQLSLFSETLVSIVCVCLYVCVCTYVVLIFSNIRTGGVAKLSEELALFGEHLQCPRHPATATQ